MRQILNILYIIFIVRFPGLPRCFSAFVGAGRGEFAKISNVQVWDGQLMETEIQELDCTDKGDVLQGPRDYQPDSGLVTSEISCSEIFKT